MAESTLNKPLSDKQAQSCENAAGKVCRCRCGGALHGRRGGGTNASGSIDRTYFEGLPDDDPHRLPTAEEKTAQAEERREARNAQKRAATAEKNRKVMAAYAKLYSKE